jgi:CheY-like chemotaxis protein
MSEALGRAHAKRFDAILMDFVMPVMDGPTATKLIRTLGYTSPIIGCTGNTLDVDRQRFVENGCDRIIGKPFQLALMYQYMDELAAEKGAGGDGDGKGNGKA